MWHLIPMTVVHIAFGQHCVSELGNKDYRVRTMTSRYLYSMVGKQDHDCPVILALEKAGHSKDAEVRYRATIILQNRKSYCDKKWIGSITKFPWIDMLPKGYPDRYYFGQHYLAIATDKYHLSDHEDDDYEAYRLATKLFLIYKLKQGSTRKQMKSLLKQMWENEKQWCYDLNYVSPK